MIIESLETRALLATFVVDRIDDTNAAAAQVCSAAANDCSLRGAISAANALAGNDIITFDPATNGTPFTLTLTNVGGMNEDANATGDLDVLPNGALTVTGNGLTNTIIQAGTNSTNGIDKVFGINPICTTPIIFGLSDVTVRFGRNTQTFGAPDFSFTGGGIDYCGVGASSLTLANSLVTQNTNVNGYGGGLNLDEAAPATSTITITNTQFTNNTSAKEGGGLNIYGDNAQIQITGSTFANNQTQGSGGVGQGGGANIRLTNQNDGDGAPIPSVTIDNSTVSNNSAAGTAGGGGIAISPGTASGQNVVIRNTTISGNSALADGGGLFLDSNVSVATLTNVTITNNRSDSNDTSPADNGGGVYVGVGMLTLKNTLVAGNFRGTGTTRDDVNGTLVGTSSFNLIGDGTGLSGISNGVNNNQVGSGVSPINPLLATLANYGGTVQTHALLPGSPALNVGTNSGAPAVDARGVARPQQSVTDIGAFESRGFTLSVSSGSGQSTTASTAFSLPLVVGVAPVAGGEPVNGGVVTFTPPVAGVSATLGSPTATISSVQASTTATANATAGVYNVTANAAGSTGSVSFNLTNVPPNSLTATVDGSGNLTVTDVDGVGKNNQFTISSDGSNLIVSDAIEQFQSAPAGWTLEPGGTSIRRTLASFTGSITVDGALGSDTLTIDNSLGDVVPNGGIAFNGGAGTSDTLALVGGSTTSQTFNFTNEHDGSVVLAGAVAGTVNYIGLEPVTSTINATDVILIYSDVAETITMSAAGLQTQVDSNVGGEVVTFNNPTGSLQIYAGSVADVANDVITLTGFGTGLSADLMIDGRGGSDTINLDASGLTTTSAILTAETIAQTQAVSFGGTTTLDAGVSGTITLNNAANIFGTVAISSASTASLRDDGGFVLGTSTVSIDLTVQSAGAITQSGMLSGNATLNKLGAGTMTLSQANTFSGNAVVTGGTLRVSGGAGIADTTAVQMNGGTFDLNGTTETTGGLFGASGSVTLGSGGALTVAPPALSNSTLTAAISGAGSVTLNAPSNANWTLNGINSYTGATIVAGGTLKLSGAFTNNIALSSAIDIQTDTTRKLDVTGLTSGTFVLANGQTLKGNGQIVGKLTASAGSIVSPGASTGILTQNGNLTFQANSTFTAEVNGNMPGTGHDQIDVTGTVALGSAKLVTSGTITSSPNQVIVLIKNDGTDAVSGTFNNPSNVPLPEGSTVTINGVNFLLSYVGGSGGNDVTLTQAGPVSYTSDGLGAGALELRLNGTNLEFVDDGLVVDSRPLSAVTTVTVNGVNSQNETLYVNYTNTSPASGFFVKNITWHGGTGVADNDKLKVSGGSFTTVTHTFNTTGPEKSGDILYNTGAQTATITYDGLEPIDMTGSTIAALVFNLPGAVDQAILEDDAGASANVSQIRSQNGTPTFDTTTFTTPTTSLTVNMGGDTGALTVASMDAAFNAALSIVGQVGTDTVSFTGTNTGLTALSVNVGGTISNTAAANVQTSGNASFTGGSVTLGTTVGDQFRFGTLTFVSAGAASISEDDATALTGSSSGTTVSLTSAGAMTDADNNTTNKITATTLSLTGTSLGASGSGSIDVSVDELTTNSSAANGDQFLVEANGLTAINLGAGSGNVMLALTAGAAADADAAVDAVATALSISAISGIGAANAIQTTVSSLSATVSSAGNIRVNETDAVTLTNVTTFNGSITIDAAGTVTATNVTNATDASNVITITTTSGNILTNNISAPGDTITLNAAGAIEESGADGTSDVIASVLNLTAATGIGALGTLEINGFSSPTHGLTAAVTGAGPIDVSDVSDLRILSATTANGAISIVAASGVLIVETVSAGGAGGTVALASMLGAIADDASNATRISGTTATLTAGNGSVGASGANNEIDTTVTTLNASSTNGSIFVNESDGLMLNSLTASGAGVNNVSVTNNLDTITVQSIAASDSVTLVASETVGSTDHVTLTATAMITAGANVALQAGDNFSLPAGSTVTASGAASTVVVTSLDTVVDANGSTISFQGDVDVINNASATRFQLNGANVPTQFDTFNVTPDQDGTVGQRTPITISGDTPVVAPGDVLNLTITGLTTPALTVNGVTAGSWSFGNAASVTYASIETVNTTPAGTLYDLILDLDPTLSMADLNGDTINVRKNGTNLELRVDGTLVFDGADADIRSLQVLGGNTTAGGNVPNDTLEIEETASGLPDFAGTSAAPGSHVSGTFTVLTGFDNTTLPVKVHFDGRSGVDAVRFLLTTSHGAVYTSDDLDTNKSGNVGLATDATFATPQLGLSFENVAPLTFVGAGGSLVIDASSSPSGDVTSLSVIAIGVDPVAGLNAGSATDGSSIVYPNAGSTTFEPTLFSGFANVTIRSGAGVDTVDLTSVDGSTPAGPVGAQALTAFTLDADNLINADNSNDTLVVRSLPSNVTVTLLSGLGNDNFNIYDDQGNASTADDSADSITGQVVIGSTSVDEGGVDTLTVRDFADATGDTVNITATTIDGIFDSGAGTDIVYNNNIDVLTIDFANNAVTANDTINLNFGGTSNDLDTVTLNGNGGADTFNLQTNSASAAQTQLNGNAGADLFTLANASVLRGDIDGGSQNDLIDWSAYVSSRTIQLTGLGATNGFSGTDASGTSSLIGASGSFTNIDAVRGSSVGGDVLIGANLRNHWDLGGNVASFGPYGSGAFNLANSLVNSGVLVADEADISLTGNATVIGRATGANPITPSGGEQDLAWQNFENLTGAITSDDWFDLRNGASLSGQIDGRGGNDSLDYRDYSTAINVNLTTGGATNIFGGAAAGLIAGTGGASDGSSIENVFGGDGSDIINGDQDDSILGDGFGSDSLYGAEGSDVFRLEPGASTGGLGASSDVLTDITGSDTVDFRFSGAGVTIDLDLVGTAQDVLAGVTGTQLLALAQTGGQTPAMASPFENIVGSQFNDTLSIIPLDTDGNLPSLGSALARNVDGNNPPGGSDPVPPGDTLIVDARGSSVADSGSQLSFTGFGNINYTSIETLTIVNVGETSIVLDGSNNLVIDDVNGGTSDDTLTIQSDTVNSRFVISDPNNFLNTSIPGATGAGTHIVLIPFTSVAGSQIFVNTLAGNDSLTVDLSLGDFSESVIYDGGTQTTSDKLTLTGGVRTFATVTHAATDVSSGTIAVTGNGSISYTGLEPVTDNLNASDRVFTFNGGAETITVTDGSASDGKMRIDSTLSELIDFVNPTGSLTINAGTGNDIVTVTSVDASFGSALTINGGVGDDTINLNSNLTFASGMNLDVDLADDDASPGADTILMASGKTIALAGTGKATLVTNRNIGMAATSKITSVNGDITLTANGIPTGNYQGIQLSQATLSTTGSGNISLVGKSAGQSGTNNNHGIYLDRSTVGGIGTGSIVLDGTGGVGVQSNLGIWIDDGSTGLGSNVTTIDGNIQITGKGGGNSNGNDNIGVRVEDNSVVESTGIGTVTISGTAGTGGNGTIGFTSVGNGAGTPNPGPGASVRANGGAITINGFSGTPSGGSFNQAIMVGFGGRVISTGTATISLVGVSTATTGNQNSGVEILSTGTVQGMNGLVTLEGKAGVGTASVAIVIANGANVSSTGSANLEIIGDTVNIGTASATIGFGANTTLIRQRTNGIAIGLGSADSASVLGLTDAELDRITANTLNIGDNNSGAVTVSTAITRPTTTNIAVESGTGNDISFVAAGSIDSAGGNISLKASGIGSILSGTAASDLIAGTGTIRLDADSGLIGAAGNPISMSGASLITASNGNTYLSSTGSIDVHSLGLSAGSNTIELNSGTFQLQGSNRIHDLTKLNVAGATFSLGVHNETVDTLTLTSGTISGTTGVLTSNNTIQTRSGNVTAILAGNNGLIQSTSGSTNLAAANSYTGVTTVNGGRLNINGSVVDGPSTPDVIVNNTGTLGGTGSVLGSVHVNAGGTVSPGLSPGILNTGSISYSGGSSLAIEVNGQTPGTGHDQLNVTGTVSLNNATLNAIGTVVSAANWSLIIINNDGTDAVSGTFNGLPEGATVVIDGVNFTISYMGGSNNNDVVLNSPLQLPPDLQNPGPQTIPNGAVNGIVNLIATDPNNDPLTFNATAQSLEYYWDQQLGLSPAPLSMYLNWGGLKEKWFTGTSYPYYYMTPNGQLYLWRGGALSNDIVVAQFSPEVYQNPASLYNASPSGAPVTLTLVGNVLTINPNDNFVGSFLIVATANDGFGGTDSELFTVTVLGAAPDTTAPTITNLAPTPSSTITTSIVNIDVTFSETVSGVDATDLVLTGAGAAGAMLGTPTNIGANTWRFPVSNLTNGAVNISLAPDANDIEDSVGNDLTPSTWFYSVSLALAQHPPVLNPIPNQSVANGSLNAVVSLVAIDPNNDPLTFSGSVQSIERYIDQKYNLSFSGSYYFNYGGLLEKWLQGVGGWYYIQPNGKLYRWLGGDPENAVFVEQMSTVAYQNPSLLFDAPTGAGQATVNIVGNIMTINPIDTFSGKLVAVATVNDPFGGTDSEVFFVDVGPTSFKVGEPELVTITPTPNSVINRSELFIDVVFTEPVFRVEPPDLVLAGPAAAKATNGPATPLGDLAWRFLVSNLVNGHLSITLGTDEHDIQDLKMVDFFSVSWSYEVDITSSQSPTLQGIGDRNISIGPSTTAIPLSATDPNNDPLTFSAQGQSQVYYWDQSLGLSFNGSLFTNFGGKNEKWLLGAGHQWYYITPAGELYRWKGQNNLAGDEWITQLPPLYYTNIDQLYNATNSVPATVNVVGNALQITPNVGFTGVFYVIVTVNDGNGNTDSEAVKITVGI